jgi:hypothetical protein
MQATTFPSIHDNVPPLEVGGIIARDGFSFQDHVAVGFCLRIFFETSLKEVRCESQDDITLIWEDNNSEQIEFVQVKGNKLDQLWSIAKICEREKRPTNGSSSKNALPKEGSSIVEKSLANDRFSENSRFRIVTRRDVNNDLKFLCRPFSSSSRSPQDGSFKKLCKEIGKRTSGFKSPKGNGSDFWVSNTSWEVEYSKSAVKEKNISRLMRIVESEGSYLLTAKRNQIYDLLLKMVQDAALADWQINPESKKVKRDEFIKWLKEIILEAVQDSPAKSEIKKCEEKMEDAALPPDYKENARLTLEIYRREILTSKYLDTSDRMLLEGEVSATLQELRSKYDTGELSSSSIQFHAECIQKLKELQTTIPLKTSPNLSCLLQGCMYYITGRCGHRFRRIEA